MNIEFMPLVIATWQTIYMVFISSFLSIFFGLICGTLLFTTSPKQFLANAGFNRIFGLIINIARSVPFIILLISIIPLTRLLVGTSIGTNAAIVPLTIAAIPFFARITESALKEVQKGLIEAAHAMGANHWQIIYKVLLPEALPGLIRGATLTIIGLIGYSAMAGVVGGGGLGELAINFGYQRFDTLVMVETVILLILIVQLVQSMGDHLAKSRQVKWPLLVMSGLFIFLVGYQILSSVKQDEAVLKVGVISGPQEEVMAAAKKVALEQYGLKLEVIVFNDYVLPNTALNNGAIDANLFQHVPYLEAQSKAHHYHLTPIAKTFVYPIGFYSRKITRLSELKNKAIVAIPNDPSNEGRALLVLEKAGYIKLKSGVGLAATPKDIEVNSHQLIFKLLDAAQLPRVFDDADLVALTNDYVKDAGFSISQALLKEGSDSPYANVIVVREEDKDNPHFKNLIAAMHSKEALEATNKLFPQGGAVPAWKN